MSSQFHSDDAHPEARSPSTTALATIGVLAGLMVTMLLAILAPRLFADATLHWAVTLGAGVVTAVVVMMIGRSRRSVEAS
ncbi:MAG: hypothetical protein GVY18_07555 [Bacteroidetes bacterium]|jgi:energy-converting hydrogenase Eha subunit B|nr:hypothetical protein [Bacteroidota bacterium]